MDFKTFILENIKLLDDESITIEELLNRLCLQYQETTGKEITEAFKEEIQTYLIRYQNKEITTDDIISNFETKINENVEPVTPYQESYNPSGGGSGSRSSSDKHDSSVTKEENIDSSNNEDKSDNQPLETEEVTNETKETPTIEKEEIKPIVSSYSSSEKELPTIKTEQDEIVDIEVDMVMEASEQYASVESTIESATVEIPSSVSTFTGEIVATINETKEINKEALNENKESLITIYESIEAIDGHITNNQGKKFDFNDIWVLAYNKKTGSKLKVADLDFFKKNKNCTINGNIVTFKQNGKTYTYNLDNKTLSVNGDNVKVGFFVPQGANDYSKLNTFTYFIQDGYDNPTAYPSDAIVIRFLKSDVEVINGNQHTFMKQRMFAESTRFMNGVANTDLDNCQNIIGGDSLFGAESLKLAANNGNLYQTVYCVNNAVLVTGKNASKGNKAQFSSLNELKGLNGKTIYFISAKSDQNFDHCSRNGSGWVQCGYNEGYVFTGLDLIANNCPDANVYLIYSNNGIPAIKSHYASLDKKYNNVHYLSDKWYSFAKKDYVTHTDGNRIMPELVSAIVTSYNAYS